ncbi:GNAT family N-acetyltransferase [Paenibacillus riograndensis]|nr:GNAT family N-acetyltransferase [Paenibacillus riograndensis]
MGEEEQKPEHFPALQHGFRIHKGSFEWAEDVLKLLREAAGWMESKGIRQWTPGQFVEQDIQGYFTDREVYLALDGNALAGMFTLQFSDAQYWGERNDESYAYLHRLTVAQTHRGGGLGRQMIGFAVLKARELGRKGLRLDTAAHNVKLNRYYQSMGFRYMGTRDVGEGRLVNLYEYGSANGHSMRLRYMDALDFGHLQRWSLSADFLKQWAGPSFTYPLDHKQLTNYLEGANHPAESDKLIYCAVEGEEQQVVGHISLSAIDRANGSARISRVIVDPAQQGRGIGQRMIQELLRIGFDGLRLHRLSLGAFSFNQAALKCYERAGFIREGIQREAALFGENYTDCIQLSILDREWRARKA